MNGSGHTQMLVRTLVFLLFMAGVTQYLSSFEAFKPHTGFCWLSNAMFAVHAAILYIILWKSSTSPNRQIFLNVTLVNSLVKMAISVAFLVLYKVRVNPPNGKFIIPFVVIYVMYTIFETVFMLNLAEQKPKINTHESQ